MNLTHDTQEVASPDFLDVLFRVTPGKELTCEVDHLRGISHATHATITVEVGSYAYMVDSMTCMAWSRWLRASTTVASPSLTRNP